MQHKYGLLQHNAQQKSNYSRYPKSRAFIWCSFSVTIDSCVMHFVSLVRTYHQITEFNSFILTLFSVIQHNTGQDILSFSEHPITIQVGDKRGGLLAWDLSTNPGIHCHTFIAVSCNYGDWVRLHCSHLCLVTFCHFFLFLSVCFSVFLTWRLNIYHVL